MKSKPEPLASEDEFINLLATAPSILEFNLSQDLIQHFWYLASLEEQGNISPEETDEMLRLEHLNHVLDRAREIAAIAREKKEHG
jgi:hypothetical protein